MRYLTIDKLGIHFWGKPGAINAHWNGIFLKFQYNNKNQFLTQLIKGLKFLILGKFYETD